MRVVIAIVALVFPCLGRTWHVPNEIPTLQAALDTCANRDTIFASIGVYAEALLAPPRFVYMIGDTQTVADSLLRPVLDPSSLDSSTSLSIMRVPAGASVSFERFVFRNGPEMFPHIGTGGIVYGSYDSMIVKDCLFDSVARGIFPFDLQARPHSLIERCEFVDMQGPCANLRGPATVRECYVHGNGFSGFGVFDSSLVENCRFTGNTENGWLESYRHDAMIRDNTFGPGTHGSPPLVVVSRGGADSVLNNVFNCTGVAWKMMVSAGEGPPVVISGNLITDTSATPGRVASLVEDYDVATDELHVVFSDNVVSGGGDLLYGTKAISLSSEFIGVEISHNRFINIPGGGEVIEADSNVYHHVVRNNIFSGNAYAIRTYSAFTLDARLNWWGDSTGPYHAVLNPGGLGDSLDSAHPIDFEPWWMDTLFWSTSRDGSPSRPQEYRLAAYPNPANANVVVSLAVPRPTLVELKLFDVLGREVRTLWIGMVEITHSWSFELGNYATGTYFIRVENVSGEQLAAQRIILLK